MPPSHRTQIIVAARPTGDVTPDIFKREVLPFDLTVGDGEVLIRVVYISLDPAMRGWLGTARTYAKPIEIGEVMRAGGLGVVVQTGRNSKFSSGDLVYGTLGESCHTCPTLSGC